MGKNIKIYQIYYDDLTKSKIDDAFIPFDNSSNPRPDWREYWVMRSILLNEKFDQDCYVGIFSPKFYEKTHLHGHEVISKLAASNAEVISFSPFFDQCCLFTSPFEQAEASHPGFMALAESLLEYLNIQINIYDLVCDSTTTIFSNYFVAKFSVWQRWLFFAEKIFELCESGNTDLGRKLNHSAKYTLPVPMKVFVVERLITLLLVHWKISAEIGFDILKAPMATPGVEQSLPSLLIVDALKGQFIRTKQKIYLDSYLRMLGRAR